MLVISVGFETGNIKMVTNATDHLTGTQPAEPVCYLRSDSLSDFMPLPGNIVASASLNRHPSGPSFKQQFFPQS